jgi:hypothetical protein
LFLRSDEDAAKTHIAPIIITKQTKLRTLCLLMMTKPGGALMCKNFYRFVLVLVVAAFTCLMAGCNSIPVPEEKIAYVGTWEGVGFQLTIYEDGGVDYRRVKGKSATTVTGPLKSFKGNDFVVGVLFITTTFEVQHPPYLEGDDWFMVVDGVELRKVAGPIT